MNIKKKITIATLLAVPLTIIYYFIYMIVNLKLSDWCKTNICFEFPPYADVLAIYVAIIGLYFVVTSLDDWKNQDRYNNAKNRVISINKLKHKISPDFSMKLNMFYTIPRGNYEQKIFRLGTQSEFIVDSFKAYLKDTNVYEEIKELERENAYAKNCLYQNDFDEVISAAHKYIDKSVADIIAIKKTDTDTRDCYQKILNQIYIGNREHENRFNEKLRELNNKINKFTE